MKKMISILLSLAVLTLTLTVSVPPVSAYDPQTDAAPYHLTPAELDKSLEVPPDINRPDNYVRVLYFHRIPGCSTCQLMSKYIYETVKTCFANEVKNREVILSYHNFEDVRNTKLVKAFRIGSPTLVIIQGKDGRDTKAKKADKIWTLAGDKEAFVKYVETEIRPWLPKE